MIVGADHSRDGLSNVIKFLTKLFGKNAQKLRRLSVPPYTVYTRNFDSTVWAYELGDVLGRLSPNDSAALEQSWRLFETSLISWRTECSLKAIEASREIATQLPEARLADTVVSLLIDHSGSMRGQSILMAAAAADIAQNFLRQLGCKVEVLGFTTSSWRGGRSRMHWERSGESERPGRLCDLLHIIYSSADTTSTSGLGRGVKNMLRPDLLKENVDGEALEWAAERLFSRTEKSKLLLVLSDGVPADDSTLIANDRHYLIRHLAQVISKLEKDDRIGLMAIGLGHDVGSYYKASRRIDSSHQFGFAVIELLKDGLIGSGRDRVAQESGRNG